MKLFDAHCHLQSVALFPMIGKVMDRAAAAGVERIACCSTSSKDWNEVLQLLAEYPQIIPMIGIHPWFVSKHWKENFQTLDALLREHPEAGIGETGLDFQKHFINCAEQEASFAAHLDLARELNRLVAVHCVQAWGRLLELLREHPAPRVLLHAFGGAPEIIPELVGLNCWFSFCGSVTNPNAKRVRAAAAAVPDDRLLIETDSPDFTPAGYQPPNEPANLVQVLRTLAELRGSSEELLAGVIWENGHKLLKN
jgi:TatD DNase family protein